MVQKLTCKWTGAVSAGRHIGFLGLISIFSTLTVIDGPFLQRASIVVTTNVAIITPLNISMAPEIPHDFSGAWFTSREIGISNFRAYPVWNSTIPTADGFTSNNIITSGFYSAADGDWDTTLPLAGVVRGCPGECYTSIQAPALFPVSCATHIVPLNLRVRYNRTAVNEDLQGPPLESLTFLITTALLVKDRANEAIDLITGNATNCAGNFVYRACTY